MSNRDALRWIERCLWIVGVTLAVWCAVVFAEARRTRNMPVPAPSTLKTLPADPSGPAAATKKDTFRPPAAGAWVARLEAPTIHLVATVLEGTDDGTLARGAGHIEDTPFPGQPGNVGIAGHRDTTFRPVRRIKAGDPLVVTTPDRVYEYRVSEDLHRRTRRCVRARPGRPFNAHARDVLPVRVHRARPEALHRERRSD